MCDNESGTTRSSGVGRRFQFPRSGAAGLRCRFVQYSDGRDRPAPVAPEPTAVLAPPSSRVRPRPRRSAFPRREPPPTRTRRRSAVQRRRPRPRTREQPVSDPRSAARQRRGPPDSRWRRDVAVRRGRQAGHRRPKPGQTSELSNPQRSPQASFFRLRSNRPGPPAPPLAVRSAHSVEYLVTTGVAVPDVVQTKRAVSRNGTRIRRTLRFARSRQHRPVSRGSRRRIALRRRCRAASRSG